MIGLITLQAQAEAEKGRRKRERERLGQAGDGEAATGAHAAAEGHRAVLEAEREAREDVGKASAYHDGAEGPGHPMQPGETGPEDYRRGYITEGHAADSPSNPGPPVRRVDLTQSRGYLAHINPSAPMGPGGAR